MTRLPPIALLGMTSSLGARGHDERASVAAPVHGGVVHLLGVRRRLDERAHRRRPGDVAGRVCPGPEVGRRIHDTVVAHLAMIEGRPPSRIPEAVPGRPIALLVRLLLLVVSLHAWS